MIDPIQDLNLLMVLASIHSHARFNLNCTCILARIGSLSPPTVLKIAIVFIDGGRRGRRGEVPAFQSRFTTHFLCL